MSPPLNPFFCIAVYQQALSLAETDSDKSDVCAAMGMVAFKLGNMDEAKAALFQGSVLPVSFLLCLSYQFEWF